MTIPVSIIGASMRLSLDVVIHPGGDPDGGGFGEGVAFVVQRDFDLERPLRAREHEKLGFGVVVDLARRVRFRQPGPPEDVAKGFGLGEIDLES